MRLVAVALLLATPAAALEPRECNVFQIHPDYGLLPFEELLPLPGEGDDFFIRGATGPITDLGAGIVATAGSTEHRFHGDEGLLIDHCASGQGFHVTLREWSPLGERRLALDPTALMIDLIAAPESHSLDEARQRFGDFAGPMLAHRIESCGCAAFYPELRGDREPYRPSAVSH